MEIQGRCDEKFARVRDAFEANFANGSDLGASFAVTLNGEYVVDIWGGHLDEAKTRPWKEDTIVNVYSTTKTMAAICLLVLADRGLVDLDAPVSKYWPEFAQNGKEGVLVKHFLSHSAGLSGMDGPVTTADTYDWDKMTRMLAAQAPWWQPGTQSGYHAITQGYLIGEVVRRVTNVTLGTFLRREIADPINADFHIGLDSRHFPRVGDLIPPPSGNAPLTPPDPESVAARTFKYPPVNALDSRTPEWRRAEIPAANGHGNARSVANVDRERRQRIRQDDLVEERRRSRVRRTAERHGPRARRAGALRHGLWIDEQRLPARPESAHVFLGRLGRVARDQRRRRARVHRVRDEQDGPRYDRRRTRRRPRDGDIPSARLITRTRSR